MDPYRDSQAIKKQNTLTRASIIIQQSPKSPMMNVSKLCEISKIDNYLPELQGKNVLAGKLLPKNGVLSSNQKSNKLRNSMGQSPTLRSTNLFKDTEDHLTVHGSKSVNHPGSVNTSTTLNLS